ncbi:hypothetical protein VP01_1393g1 [Puccinia sorghi]|uniref:Uncharacterized protein n=1 Tax=Puccinia sorghi TaxID=27349 RepID=A0A0L6VL98_9BASI|nr:hypothetical protein VP01_1393g1 [Puccinia sorghi]
MLYSAQLLNCHAVTSTPAIQGPHKAYHTGPPPGLPEAPRVVSTCHILLLLNDDTPKDNNQKKKFKPPNWLVEEDLILFTVWLNTSKDAVISTNQTKGTFSDRIHMNKVTEKQWLFSRPIPAMLSLLITFGEFFIIPQSGSSTLRKPLGQTMEKELLKISQEKQISFESFANVMIMGKDLTALDEESPAYFQAKGRKSIQRFSNE